MSIGGIVGKDYTDAIDNLQNEVDAIPRVTVMNTTATLTTTNWVTDGSTGGRRYTLTVTGVLASDTPFIGVNKSGNVSLDTQYQEGFDLINRAYCAANQIIFQCYEDYPTTNIPIQIKVVR